MNSNLGIPVSDSYFIRSQLIGNNVKAAHLNCTSFCIGSNSVKFDEIKNIVSGNFLDFIGFSETWLKPTISNDVVNIPGYKCVRSDRPNRNGGGVALYIKNSINYKTVYTSTMYGTFEAIFVEVLVHGGIMLVGCLYLPNGKITTLEDKISDVILGYDNILIMGDFNCNMFHDFRSVPFREICQRLNISCLHGSIPTHFDLRRRSTSLIDFFLVSDPSLVGKIGQVQCPGISHHSLIFVGLSLPVVRTEVFYEYFDYNAVNNEELLNVIGSIDFNQLYESDNVNEHLNIFNSFLNTVHSIVPFVRRRKVDNLTNNEWIKDPEVIYYLSLRNLAHSAFLNDRTDENWRIFCRTRNKAKSIMRKFKKKSNNKIFDNLTTEQMWSKLRNYGITNSINDVELSDVDGLNRFFVESQNNNYVSDDIFFGSNLEGFMFRCVTIDELILAFSTIKSNSAGSDGFSLKFLRLIFPFFSNHILHMVNRILTTSCFPYDWKLARVTPIRKHGISDDFNNLRPISVLPILAKLVEILIKNQITDYLDSNRFLHECQYGFRRGRSSTHLLVNLTDSVRSALSNGRLSVLLSLDLCRAFDKIPHSILISKLANYFKFSSSACRLIASYLSDRFQYVSIKGSSSSILPVVSGVPQGSVLGPLLFVMFLNDLFYIYDNSMCTSFAFADDLQLLISGDKEFLDVFQANVDYYINETVDWMNRNGLVINANKTKALFFGKPLYRENISILVGPTEIEFVDRLTCLGVVIDSELRFVYHINLISSRLHYILRKLYCSNLCIPLAVRRKIVQAMIIPIFTYGIEIYTGTHGSNLKKLSLLFNRAVRYVYSLRRRDHISSYVQDFLGCSFNNFIKIRNLLLFYRTFKNGYPSGFLDRFRFSRSNRNKQILLPKLTTTLDRAYFVRVAKLYNALPRVLKSFSNSYALQKSRLIAYVQAQISAS